MKLADLEHLRERDEIAFKQEVVEDEPITIVSYMISNPELWKLPLARECRGITFNAHGECISRPFVKFFNVNEREETQAGVLLDREIAQITEKRDGSMITPAIVGGKVRFKTKKSFYSSVALRAQAEADRSPQFIRICQFLLERGYTPIFEYTDPLSRIVIDYGNEPEFTLLAVRHNQEGNLLEYPVVKEWAKELGCPVIQDFTGYTLAQLIDHDETNFEGYVLQFVDQEQVKIKTEWYKRNHHLRTDIRERDIADMVLDETLDDVKAFAATEGYDIGIIHVIEARVNRELVGIIHEVRELGERDPELSIKDYALKYNTHPLFGLAIGYRKGALIDPRREWVKRYRAEYTLNTIYSTFREE